MAITLRDNTSTNSGKGAELTYLEMDTNLESFYFSSSLDGTDLILHTTGSDNHTIDLSGLGGGGAGTQGTQGTTGTSGIDGVDGAQGVQGFSGIDGVDGAQGTQGTAGLDGAAASQGDPGAQGTQGIQGTQGTTGDASTVPGPQGIQGAQGISGAGLSDNLYTANGTIQSIRTVLADGNDLTFSFADADFKVISGGGAEQGGDVIISDLRNGSTDSMLMINPGTGVVSWMVTSSLNVASSGGSGTPGGVDTQVQFNDGGAFGGDSGFTYDKTNNTLTLTAASTGASTTYPALYLATSDTAPTVGDVVGLLQAKNTYGSGDTYNAGIKFTADGTWTDGGPSGPPSYPTRIDFQTSNYTSETTRLTIKADGKVGIGNETPTSALTVQGDISASGDLYAAGLDNTAQANFAGYNTSTGKITYFSTGSFKNPSIAGMTATNVVFDVTIAPGDANWTLSSVTVTTEPTLAGRASINNSSPNLVTQVAFWKTANGSVDMSGPLTQLAPGSIITISENGSPSGTAKYLVTLKNVNPNTVSYNVSYLSGAANTFSVGASIGITTDLAIFEYDLAPGYNYLNIRNNGSSNDRLRLRYEAATGTYPDGGGYIPVQILCNGSGQAYSIDYIGDNKTYSWDVTDVTGTFSSTNPAIGYLTNTFNPGDRFVGSFLVWGEGLNEGIVPQHWALYNSAGEISLSHRDKPTHYYQNTYDNELRITMTSTDGTGTQVNLTELNGGTINIDPQGGSTDKLILGLGSLLSDWGCSVNNISGANGLAINIVTPSSKNGWNVYWVGYVSSTNERYRLVNTSINGGTGVNAPKDLDWSGRLNISVDYSESKIIIWSSNWE